MENEIEMRDLSGIQSDLDYDNPLQLFEFIDVRGFNLLLIAAENGADDLVVDLLNIGFDVNSSFGPHTAANLAYQNNHYNTLLILLHANSKFPIHFNANKTQHTGLIEFDALMTEFHDCIGSEDSDGLQRKINEHPNLRYFFRNGGKSAAFEALSNMIFSSYEILVSRDVIMALDEDFDEAIKSFEDEQKNEIKIIHERYAKALPNNHLMIIHGSTFVGHDIAEADRTTRLELAQNTVNFLDSIPAIQPMLKLIARAGCFKIIFDFNRDNIQFINPTSDKDVRGLFCSTRHIYIGARNLFDEKQKYQVFGTIAHEMCHFAMDLVYDNESKPYKREDNDTIGRTFYEILIMSRQFKDFEEIIDAVFNYPHHKQLAELIVRVPHLEAAYSNDQMGLNAKRFQFKPLFEFYNDRVLPDIEQKIPTITAEMNQRREELFDRTYKRASKWRKVAKVSMFLVPICVIIASLLTYFNVFEPHYEWSKLTSEEKMKVMNGSVRFVDEILQFSDIFNKSHDSLLNSLNSHQLKTLINGDKLDLSDSKNVHLEKQVYLVYSNLTEILKPKVSNACINFQDQTVLLFELVDNDTQILESFNAQQIFHLLKNESFVNIGNELNNDTNIFIERKFIDRSDHTDWKNERKKIFNNFRNYLDNKDFVRVPSLYEHDFDNLTFISESRRMIMLSDEGGMGKTVIFKNFALKLKHMYPHKWIVFVQLRNHTKIFEKYPQYSSEVLDDILSLNKIDAKIFKRLFDLDRIIFLWDGFDEILPKHSNLVLNTLNEIYKETRNIQWLSTRPIGEDYITKIFPFYMLVPFTNEDNEEYYRKFFASKNLTAEEIQKSNSTLRQIIRKNSLSEDNERDDIESPLLTSMIAEISVDNKDLSLNVINLYTIYLSFVIKKVKMTHHKGDVVEDIMTNAEIASKKPTFEQYQYFALKSITNYINNVGSMVNDIVNIEKLKIIEVYRNRTFDFDLLSRQGILLFNSDGKGDFIHRRFAEFLITQYIADNIYEEDEKIDIAEAEERIKLFYFLLTNPWGHQSSKLIIDYFESKQNGVKLNDQFKKLMIEKFQNFFYESFDEDVMLFKRFVQFLKIFGNDKDLLRILWHVDESQTFITWLIQEDFYEFGYEKIKLLVLEYFPDKDDYERILFGKFQLGNILLTELFHSYTTEKSEYIPDIEAFCNMTIDSKKLKSMKKFTEFYRYVKSFLNHDEKREIFLHNFYVILNYFVSKIDDFNEIWLEIEKDFNKTEIAEFFIGKSIQNSNIFVILKRDIISIEYVDLILSKFENYVENSTNLFQYLYNNNRFWGEYWSLENMKMNGFFDRVWSFVEKYTNYEDRKKILKPKYSKAKGYLQNILARAIFDDQYKVIMNVYEKYFNECELREIFLKYFQEKILLIESFENSVGEDLMKYFEIEKHDLNNDRLRDILPEKYHQLCGSNKN